MFGMSQQQQVALIQQMAQLQLMNGMQKTPNNLAGGKLQKKRSEFGRDAGSDTSSYPNS